ncbi:MAG: type II toxin-antitoxin system VapC family toxin [Pseudomonadota bacterium]|nr:type II toxin-antitoxin system VapC family toxin [Pseudomonadota bacterium]MDP1904614.1 type II toxin-antitoxin system VapC family toxin [Pseudomonadota bacterium]MDP2353259.1 type II toxin-antitoxin system VapC family toxin [Pseudomonadota bacterium]
MPFVVDNSVVVAWFFPSQATDYTDSVLDRLKADTAHVPALWMLEFSNVLRKAVMGRKLATESALEIIAEAEKLPLSVDYTATATAENMALALRFGLSSYDAAYLDLAMRLGLPIAAKDGALHAAALRAGVGVVA